MKFTFNSSMTGGTMSQPKVEPTIKQDQFGAWWVDFHRLGAGAVVGPLANQGYALKTVQNAFGDEVEFTPEEQLLIDKLMGKA